MPSGYFDRFPTFDADPEGPLLDQFAALAIARNWKPGTKKYHKNRQACLEQESALAFTEDATKLQTWQALCEEVGIKSVPDSIKKCKKALRTVHVNIVDLIDSRRAGTSVRRFKSRAALIEYTRETNKIYPRALAKADGFLKALLREIF
ncbi:MAG: hypothetical protein M1817_000518 [Caeruleum heppii]|nr:MAG: hypothetical protein M1817_000518 [Caeruleum heppii]